MTKEIGNWNGSAPLRRPLLGPRTNAAFDDSRAIVEPLLQPGEQLVWHACGRGPHWPPSNIFAAIFLPAWILVMSLGLTMSALAGKTPIAMVVYGALVMSGVTFAVGAGIIHAVLSPGRDCYGLTNRRVIVVNRFLGRRERVFDVGNIKVLHIRDGATGDITFWKQNPRYVNRAWAIVGVDNPRQIAELIRTTLTLDLSVTDGRTTKEALYIPPLEPRRPN